MGSGGRTATLFCGVAESLAFGFALGVDHPPDVADAFGALQPSSAVTEHIGRTRCALGKGRADVALPDAVTVANVHQQLRGDDPFFLQTSNSGLESSLQLIRNACAKLRRPPPKSLSTKKAAPEGAACLLRG
jgi:hypothetical protein